MMVLKIIALILCFSMLISTQTFMRIKTNGGLGQARNFGYEFVTGDYVTFVDSHDIIPNGSYKMMMNTILQTESDFIIGNVVRFNSTKEFPSVLHKKYLVKIN